VSFFVSSIFSQFVKNHEEANSFTNLPFNDLFPNVCLCKEWESGSISKGDIHQKDALVDCTGILLLLMAEILQHLVHVKSY